MAAQLARAEIARRLKLKKGDAEKLDKAPKTVDITINEDAPTGGKTPKPKTVKGVAVAAKPAPKAAKAVAPDAVDDADSPEATDGAEAVGEGDGKAGDKTVDVTIKVDAEDKKNPAKKKDKSVKITYKSDGKQGLSKAEAQSFMDSLSNTLSSQSGTYDDQQTVTIEGKKIRIAQIKFKSEQGEDPVDPAAPKADGTVDDKHSSPLGDPNSTSAARRKYLEGLGKEVDNLINMLLDAIASGNFGAIIDAFNLLALKTGINTSDLADIVGQALNKVNKDSKAINDKIVDVLKAPNQQAQQAKIYDLRTQLGQMDILKDTLSGILKDSATRQQAATELKESIMRKMEEIMRSGSR